MKKINLKEGEYIYSAHAEKYSGASWANRIIEVGIKNDRDSTIRIHHIQPEDFTPDIFSLFDFSEMIHGRMMLAVKAVSKTAKKS